MVYPMKPPPLIPDIFQPQPATHHQISSWSLGFEDADHGKPWSIDSQQRESNWTGCSNQVRSKVVGGRLGLEYVGNQWWGFHGIFFVYPPIVPIISHLIPNLFPWGISNPRRCVM